MKTRKRSNRSWAKEANPSVGSAVPYNDHYNHIHELWGTEIRDSLGPANIEKLGHALMNAFMRFADATSRRALDQRGMRS